MDLFDKKTKKDMLKEWILSRNFTTTAQIDQWGLDNFHIRARRDAQDMAAAGEFRRMTEDEHKFYFSGTKQGVYVRNDFK